jgi:hypothetical protein
MVKDGQTTIRLSRPFSSSIARSASCLSVNFDVFIVFRPSSQLKPENTNLKRELSLGAEQCQAR